MCNWCSQANVPEALSPHFRVIAMDQRNAGASRAPVSADDGWHTYTRDQLALLALLIYAYATGIFSSRKIEQATDDSLAFRYIACNLHPDHDTLNSFRQRLGEALSEFLVNLFGERILPFDREAAMVYAQLVSRARTTGRQISVADGQIAAVATLHGFAVATRDRSPFDAAGAGRVAHAQRPVPVIDIEYRAGAGLADFLAAVD